MVLTVCLLTAGLTHAETAPSSELVVQTGHSVAVHGLVIGPRAPWGVLGIQTRAGAGRLLATGSNDGTAKVWDLVEKRELRTFQLATGRSVNDVAMSPDGRLIAAVGGDTGRAWSVSDGAERRVFPGLADANSVAFSPDGALIAIGGDATFVWNVSTGKLVLRIPARGHRVAFGPANLLAVVGMGPSFSEYPIEVWDTKRLARIGSYRGKGGVPLAVRFDAQGSLSIIARWVCGKNKAICAPVTRLNFNIPSPSEKFFVQLRSLDSYGGPPIEPLGAAFCGSNSTVAAVAWDGTLTVWDYYTQTPLFELKAPDDHLDAVACGPGSDEYFASSASGAILAWSAPTGRLSYSLEGFANSMDRFALSPDARNFAVQGRAPNFSSRVGSESLLRWDVWSVGPPMPVAKAKFPFAMSADGKTFVTGLAPDSYAVARDGQLGEIAAGPSNARTVALDAGGHRLATTVSGQMSVWDVSPLKLLATTPANTGIGIVNELAFSPDGSLLAAAGGDSVVTLWSVPDLSLRCTLGTRTGGADTVWSAAFSPDGSMIASGGNERRIDLWRTSDCMKIGMLSGHTGAVQQVRFSADGHRLVSAAADGTVRLWSVNPRRPLHVFRGHGWIVNFAQFAASDTIIVSGGMDGTVRLWDVATKALLATMTTFRDGDDWLIATPGGYFDGTAGAADRVYWRKSGSNDLEPLSRYFTDFYHPGLLSQLLRGQRPVPEIDVAGLLGIPGLRTMLAASPPQARIVTAGPDPMICLNVPPGAVLELAPGSMRPRSDGILSFSPADTSCAYRIDLGGLPRDRIAGLGRAATVSHRPIRWDAAASDGAGATLRVISIGTGAYQKPSGFEPLEFPSNSASEFADLFRKGRGKGLFARVVVDEPLLDRAATRTAILARLATLARESGSDDVVVIYLAGHGVLSFGDEMFHFIAADTDGNDLKQTGLSTAMLADALRGLKARRVLMLIDACQSGGSIEALDQLTSTRALIEMEREAADPTYHSKGVGSYLVASTMPLSYAVGNTDSALIAAVRKIFGESHDSLTVRGFVAAIERDLPLVSSQRFGVDFRQAPLVSRMGLDFPLWSPAVVEQSSKLDADPADGAR